MSYDRALLAELQKWRQNGFLVLATDNIDCFVEATNARPSLLAKFDGILCSSALGVLKSDSPSAFFGGWLARHGLSFADAVLIDDRHHNCARFSAAGGEAIVFRSTTDFAGSTSCLTSAVTSTATSVTSVSGTRFRNPAYRPSEPETNPG
jgi:FMN phosphatase YigB (HAD superfamily)